MDLSPHRLGTDVRLPAACRRREVTRFVSLLFEVAQQHRDCGKMRKRSPQPVCSDGNCATNDVSVTTAQISHFESIELGNTTCAVE